MAAPVPIGASALDFVDHLVSRGVIERADAGVIISRHFAARPNLGSIALRQRKLQPRQAMEVVAIQTAMTAKLRYGEIAVELGYLTPRDVQALLKAQAQLAPSIVEALRKHGLDAQVLDRELRRFAA